jgi:hypothetical protein
MVQLPPISLNAELGAPGSYFTMLGNGYAGGEEIAIAVNDHTLATIQAEADGRFTAVFNTADVPPGVYQIVVSTLNAAQSAGTTQAAAATFFTLDPTAPLRELDVPADAPEPALLEVSQINTAQTFVYLPTILR